MRLNESLTVLRNIRGYTQQYVADYLGITRGAYANYETGLREPDADTLTKLADLYGVTLDLLITGESRVLSEPSDGQLSRVEWEFLDWVRATQTETFFEEFSLASEQQKSDMMRGLRVVWEIERGRSSS